MKGSLTGIGVGPGDADLLTVKAVKAIEGADVIMCPASAEDRPSIALSVVSHLVDEPRQEITKLIFPMTKDRDVLEETWRRNADIMAQKVATGKNLSIPDGGRPVPLQHVDLHAQAPQPQSTPRWRYPSYRG